jgi:hypothetical protein
MSEAKGARGREEVASADYCTSVDQVARRAGNLLSHGYH